MPLNACCQLWVVSCGIRNISICVLYFFTLGAIRLKLSFETTDHGQQTTDSLIELSDMIKLFYF